MTRATKRTTPKAKPDTACAHCGQPVTLDKDGNTKPHTLGPLDSDCPGSGTPPLTT